MLPQGRVCILADGNLEPLTLTPHFHERELSVVGSSDGLDYHEHARWFYERPHLDSLKGLFGLEIGADDLPEVFVRLTRGDARPVKVLVRYGDS